MAASLEEIEAIAREIRGQVVQMSHAKKTPHLGSSLSCVEYRGSCLLGLLRIDPQNPGTPAATASF